MINGLAVLGWGVGGIEAEAAMLGQPISMLIPEVSASSSPANCQKVARHRSGADRHPDAAQARRVGKFVEFFGPAWMNCAWRTAPPSPTWPRIRRHLRLLPDRCRDGGVSQKLRPQAGHRGAGRKICQGASLFRDRRSEDPVFTTMLELDLGLVVPSLAGPARPQDRVPLMNAAANSPMR